MYTCILNLIHCKTYQYLMFQSTTCFVPLRNLKVLSREFQMEGAWGPDSPPRQSQVAIGFPRKSGADPPREAIGPNGSVQPSVKYVDD